jgi:hypothetical protein
VRTHNNPGIFSSNLTWTDTLPKYFWWQSNCPQLPEDLRKSVAVRDRTCPCVSWISCRIFWTFIANCDLINNKNSTFIKLGTCIVNVYHF